MMAKDPSMVTNFPDIVNIKIRVCDDQVIMLSYDIEHNKQISCLTGSS